MTRSRRRTKAAKSAVAKAATCAATPATAAAEHAPEIARKLLAWYDRERRDLPWRAPPGTLADPYAVWLSEIMLQQTTVKAVIPYYRKFLALWPSVEQLAAAADEDAVLAAWAGLGYYSRARNLHACAKAVVADHAGRFPSTERDLLELPGIGPYTAAAIAAIAFGRAVTPVDGNIERVTSRLFEIEAPLPKSKPEITAAARALAPDERAGDFAQAMMDLGATICTPKRPSCLVCPIQAPVSRPQVGRSGAAAAQGRQARTPDAIRRSVCRVARGWGCPVAPATGHWPAGAHGRGAVDNLGRNGTGHRKSPPRGSRQSEMERRDRGRRPYLHAFSPRIARPARGCAERCAVDYLGRWRTVPLGQPA
jgi:A/G-specific adenine glycosylase